MRYTIGCNNTLSSGVYKRTFIVESLHKCLKGNPIYTVGIGRPGAFVPVLVPRSRQVAGWASAEKAREFMARKHPDIAEHVRVYEVEFTTHPNRWARYVTSSGIRSLEECRAFAEKLLKDGDVYAARVREVGGDVVAGSTIGVVTL